jgi:hypothetical protein
MAGTIRRLLETTTIERRRVRQTRCTCAGPSIGGGHDGEGLLTT